MNNTALKINNQSISGSFFGKLCRDCGGKYNAGRALYKARNKRNIITYLMWLKREGLLNTSTNEMDYNKREMERWIDKYVMKMTPEPKPKRKIVEIKKKSEPTQIRDIINDII